MNHDRRSNREPSLATESHQIPLRNKDQKETAIITETDIIKKKGAFIIASISSGKYCSFFGHLYPKIFFYCSLVLQNFKTQCLLFLNLVACTYQLSKVSFVIQSGQVLKNFNMQTRIKRKEICQFSSLIVLIFQSCFLMIEWIFLGALGDII